MFAGISFVKHPMVPLLYIPLYLSFYMLIPIAIHGGMRYRMSRTSWRGIRLSYGGKQKELIMAYVKALPLFLITLGLYAPYFQVKIRRIMFNNVKIGNVHLKFTGEGDEYLGINLGGGLLSLITLGIYSFWLMKNQFNFLFGKIKIEQEDKWATVNASMTAGSVFKNLLSSLALTVFTLGIAYPWVKIRNIAFVFDNLIIDGNIDWNSLQQSNFNQGSAMGDELGLMVDAPSLFDTM